MKALLNTNFFNFYFPIFLTALFLSVSLIIAGWQMLGSMRLNAEIRLMKMKFKRQEVLFMANFSEIKNYKHVDNNLVDNSKLSHKLRVKSLV